jgi:hypothetical protein
VDVPAAFAAQRTNCATERYARERTAAKQIVYTNITACLSFSMEGKSTSTDAATSATRAPVWRTAASVPRGPASEEAELQVQERSIAAQPNKKTM